MKKLLLLGLVSLMVATGCSWFWNQPPVCSAATPCPSVEIPGPGATPDPLDPLGPMEARKGEAGVDAAVDAVQNR